MNVNKFSYLGLLSYKKLFLYIVNEQQQYMAISIMANVAHICTYLGRQKCNV
jgi:hypothetical protein